MAETMTLGEALPLRADMQRRISELRTRLLASAQVQEGETPPEEPQALLGELEQTARSLQDLIARINRTNLTVAMRPVRRSPTRSRAATCWRSAMP